MDWEKYIAERDEENDNSDEAARKVLREDFEFTVRNAHLYALCFILGLAAIAIVVGAFLSVMHVIYN